MRDPRFVLGIVPMANQKMEYDPVLSEAWRVRADIRNPDRRIDRGGVSIKLTPQEYAKMKSYIADVKMWPGDRTTPQYLKDIIGGREKFQGPSGSMSFADAPEQDGGDDSIYTQREIIESIYNEAKKRAADLMLYEDANGSGELMRRFQKEQDKQRVLDHTPRPLPNFPQGAGGSVPQLNFEVK